VELPVSFIALQQKIVEGPFARKGEGKGNREGREHDEVRSPFSTGNGDPRKRGGKTFPRGEERRAPEAPTADCNLSRLTTVRKKRGKKKGERTSKRKIYGRFCVPYCSRRS